MVTQEENKRNCILDFARALAKELKLSGRYGTARSYTCATERFIEFTGHYDMKFEELDSSILKDFERHLLMQNKSRNTISMYMRMLRTVCNQAVEREIAMIPAGLFRDVFTGTDTSQKRAVSTQVITKMSELDPEKSWSISFARDIFMLSFYLRGIPFVDLAHLRKSDLKNGLLKYRRSKTKKLLSVVVEPCALAILNKYARFTKGSPYLLPLIIRPGEDEYLQYQSALRWYNKNLENLSDILNLKIRLTSYVPRHSWATAAYREGIPVSIISEALGHASEQVTYHYLTSFDDRTLRDANKKVISLISGDPLLEKSVVSSKRRTTRYRQRMLK